MIFVSVGFTKHIANPSSFLFVGALMFVMVIEFQIKNT